MATHILRHAKSGIRAREVVEASIVANHVANGKALVGQTSEAAEKLGFGVILSEAKNLSSI
jgi:hypothetical protein